MILSWPGAVQSPEQISEEVLAESGGDTKIDWTFAHKNWYFTATNYALFQKFRITFEKKRHIRPAAFRSSFRMRPI